LSRVSAVLEAAASVGPTKLDQERRCQHGGLFRASSAAQLRCLRCSAVRTQRYLVRGRDLAAAEKQRGTRQVINHSLLKADFKPGQLPRGLRGESGPAGANGDTGPSGPAGIAQVGAPSGPAAAMCGN